MASLSIPRTTAEALDPAWLTQALAPATGGAQVASVAVVQEIRTIAAKIRVRVAFADASLPDLAICLKGCLDAKGIASNLGGTMLREADFYMQMAPRLSMRLPRLLSAVVDREAPTAILLLEDLVARGARFCGALEPYSLDDAAASLEQIARLHTAPPDIVSVPWANPWMLRIIDHGHVDRDTLQGLMADPRGEHLPAATRDADAIIAATRSLALKSASGPQVLLHGDTHAGNIFMTAEGPGLNDWQNYMRGLWAVDVAYHIGAVLPVEVAEREERRLLDHYLDAVRRFGGEAPDRENAWNTYRRSTLWGFYMWAITRSVEPPIIHEFNKRLGSQVTRHDSIALLRD